MRKAPDEQATPIAETRWAQWLNARSPGFYFFAAVMVAALIVAFVMSISEHTLALVAGTCFLGLLLRLLWTLPRDWRESELHERIIGVVFAVILTAAAAANFIRAMLLS